MSVLKQLEELIKSNIEITRAHSYLLSKYPNLPNVEPKAIAKQFREYSLAESTSLDINSSQNLKKELRKTYHENNIDFLANSN
jgi:hypothetical protein